MINYTDLRTMTYTELGVALTKGRITESALRQYYKVERRKAQSRISKLRSPKIQAEYGKIDLPRFQQEKNLITSSSLLHEIADLNKFLNKRESLVSGLRAGKEARLQQLEEMGMDTTSIENNWLSWTNFVNWFNLSEYAMKFEYLEMVDVFEERLKNKENPTVDDWERAFKAYEQYQNKKSRRKHY